MRCQGYLRSTRDKFVRHRFLYLSARIGGSNHFSIAYPVAQVLLFQISFRSNPRHSTDRGMLDLQLVLNPMDGSLPSTVYAVAALPLLFLLLWRLWKFSLVTVFWPQEPKEIPYWVPGEVDLELVGRLSHSFVLT